MRKIKHFLVLYILVLLFTIGCTSSLENATSENLSWENVISEPYYEVCKIRNHGKDVYLYYVFDSTKEVWDYGFSDRMQPQFSWISDDILKLSISFGTNAQECKYYDVAKNKSSERILSPLAECEKYVAYFSGAEKGIIVQDVFDKQIYYRFFNNFKYNISQIITTSIRVTFVNDSEKIKITYFSDGNSEEIIEIFDL